MTRMTRLHDASPAEPGPAPSSPLGWLIVFCMLAALQLAGGSLTVKAYDEGLILSGAAQVAQGALPYRDFWSMYGPGSFYLLAGLDHP